ncbi:MAG: oxidoreductase, zinc-binding dehydrogenase family [Micavibrio sp.]|nr:oxidoreductase, zinc-binding dehydrogenase family [Micavibrio sp.]
MIPAKAYAAQNAKSPLAPWSFERRDVGPDDVLIDIAYCGVCHSDIHQARNEWGGATFPMVPGHEIVGTVAQVGANVKKFKAGDRVGVGCMVDSCRECAQCKADLEQFCEKGMSGTYNGFEQDKKTPTQGGYSDKVVVTQDFVLSIPDNLPLDAAAPLLCAGITTYSPLRHWKIGKGDKVGIIGLGGLGHMGVKFAAAFGAETYVITTSPGKAEDAKRLGAVGTVVSKDKDDLAKHAGSFDFLLCTVAAEYDPGLYLGLLKVDGTMAVVGAPDKPLNLHLFSVIMGRKTLAGSLIGGIKETQEMLDFCGEHNIVSDIEVINIQQINEAYERMIKSDVRYRFSIDMKSLAA